MIHQDIIYGEINLPPLISAIVNTRLFQRLKKIKQVGLLHLIFSEGKHTRYEHCIGTYYNANKMLECLEKNTKNLIIPELEKNCVRVAGLLHDIGHGPWSHTWESISPKFSHEKNGLHCVDIIFENIRPFKLSASDIEHTNGIQLIKALILGDKKSLSQPLDSKFNFIFEIISNKQCELDVDKWDYLKRDAYYLKHRIDSSIPINLNFDQVFTEARVSDDRAHIEYNFKNFSEIYNLFETRTLFHIHLYQIPLNQALESLITKIIRAIDEKSYRFEEFNFKRLTEIRSEDTEEFLVLTDDKIFEVIKSVDDTEILKLFNCLENKNIEEIIPWSDQNNLPMFPYLKVLAETEYPGEKMKEENIHFYGDPYDKPNINKTRGYYRKEYFFKITE